MGPYAKTWVAAVMAALVAVQPLLGHGWGWRELLTLLATALGAAEVCIVPNLAAGVAAYAKAIVAAVTAVSTAALQVASGPIGPHEWVTIILAALGAVGVGVVGNTPARPAAPPG